MTGRSPGTDRWQLLPELTAEEFAALKADVAARGVLVPIEVDQAGQLLDGHHRLRAYAELRTEGVRVTEPARIVRVFTDDAERTGHVLSVNLVRRHLSTEARAELVVRLRELGWSYRRIGAAAGIGEATARGDVARIAQDRAITLPERVERRGGGSYPARRPSITVNTRSEERRALAALAVLGDAAPERPIALHRAEELARTQAMRTRRAGAPTEPVGGTGWELRCGDFRDVFAGVAEASVDAIICDPPYDDGHIPLWSDLGAFAARVLRPGRVLLTYAGGLRLPEEIARLGEHLDYVWTGAVLLPGRHALVHTRQVATNHRVWLVFSRGPYEPRGWIFDTLRTEKWTGKAITDHPWRQAIGPFRELVGMCTAPGELVVDPFVGSGPVAVAAVEQHRRLLGCDTDPACVAMTREALEASAGAPAGTGEQAFEPGREGA